MPPDCDSPPLPSYATPQPPWARQGEDAPMRPLAWGAKIVAEIALPVFLAGYSCIFNNWVHFSWLLLLGVPALWLADWRRALPRLGQNRLLMLALVFLGWMTLRSCLMDPRMAPDALGDVERGLFGLVALVLFTLLAWMQATKAGQLQRSGALLGYISLAAAIISVLLFYFIIPGHVLGERLTNIFVYGGLNAVCTGLIFGFAALWLNCLRERLALPHERLRNICAVGVLLLACFFTASRGAVLALVFGHAALLIGRGWRRGLGPCLLFIAIAGLYVAAAPLVARLSQVQARARSEAAAHAAAAIPPEMALPVQHFIHRWDGGRFEIYKAGLGAMTTLQDRIIGIGQWGTKERWSKLLPRADPLLGHLHSAFLATYVHGGVIGASLLLGMLCMGFRRAAGLARAGDATWLALLAHGCGGLLFDGETLCSLASQPKFESLILWFPLIVTSAICQRGK